MMKNQINIAELLKDCPKGTKLYSPLCGECYFDRLNFGTIICKKQNTQEITFTSEGHYMLPVFDDCECMIFPSKDQRDWSKFEPPYEFKDGDVVATTNGLWIGITTGGEKGKFIPTYCVIQSGDEFKAYPDRKGEWAFNRLATEEEKQKLFQAIKDNGYHWDAENKTLEKLPKFKIGDKIIKKNGLRVPFVITGVSDDYYWSNTENSAEVLPVAEQDCWKLVPNKFDITTLKPFKSEVLVRDTDGSTWLPCFFGGLSDINDYPYRIVGGESWKCCIPYEGNEHLLGKKEDCSEYYKNW